MLSNYLKWAFSCNNMKIHIDYLNLKSHVITIYTPFISTVHSVETTISCNFKNQISSPTRYLGVSCSYLLPVPISCSQDTEQRIYKPLQLLQTKTPFVSIPFITFSIRPPPNYSNFIYRIYFLFLSARAYHHIG